MTKPGAWSIDRDRYGKQAWITQPSYWAVAVYRFGQWTKRARSPMTPVFHALYFAAYSVVRLVTGIDIPRGAEVGPGLLIHHFGGIIINPQAKIGASCTMRQGVTIGSKHDGGASPVLGDGVTLGAYAQVLGGIHVADGTTVGAMSVLLRDTTPGSVVVGSPARVVREQRHN